MGKKISAARTSATVQAAPLQARAPEPRAAARFAQPTSSMPKGHMRCFQCRRATPIKDGDWRDFQNQQVFLCKVCVTLPMKSASR